MYGGDDMRVPLLPALCLAGLLCLTACGTQAEPTPCLLYTSDAADD